MIHGLILHKGEKYYTDMAKVLNSLDGRYREYNWLITDFEGAYTGEIDNLERDYAFVTGDELFELAGRDKVYQWIWAVISGFDKSIPLEEILKYPLPYADGYDGFWHDPISIQHPLAEVEIVAWDSSLTLFISKNKKLAEFFRKGFPLSEDLSEYNNREV